MANDWEVSKTNVRRIVNQSQCDAIEKGCHNGNVKLKNSEETLKNLILDLIYTIREEKKEKQNG